jgi:rod shape determining protein RodA
MATDLGLATSRRPLASLRRSAADPWQHVDWALLAATAVLCAFGLVAIYSATYETRLLNGLATDYYVKRQGLALAGGLVAMAVVMVIDYRRFRELGLVAYLAVCGLLVALLGVARRTNGAQAWFNLGPFQLQPSEFAKVVLVVALAGYLSNHTGPEHLPFPKFVGAMVITAIPAGLVLLQPDLGTASVLVAILMGALLVAGANPKHIVVISLLSLITAATVIGTGQLDKYQQARLTTFVNSAPTPQNADLVRQVNNSRTAISLGGLTGRGYLKGPMTNGGFVPEQHTDFIFSAIAEQFGLVGAAALLIVYAFVGLRIWRTARLAKDSTGTIICVAALTMLAWHVFENIGMTMGITPVTGIPLPFISYGGSATIAFLVLIALVENVHMRRFV